MQCRIARKFTIANKENMNHNRGKMEKGHEFVSSAHKIFRHTFTHSKRRTENVVLMLKVFFMVVNGISLVQQHMFIVVLRLLFLQLFDNYQNLVPAPKLDITVGQKREKLV